MNPQQHDVWSTKDGRKIYIVSSLTGLMQLSYADGAGCSGWIVLPLYENNLDQLLVRGLPLQDFAAYDTREVVKKLAQIPNE